MLRLIRDFGSEPDRWADEVDKVVEVAEEVTEVVEKVAEGVEKVAEDMAEVLPEGGKLRGAAEFVERVAEETAKDARLVEGLIDKVDIINFLRFLSTIQAYLLIKS